MLLNESRREGIFLVFIPVGISPGHAICFNKFNDAFHLLPVISEVVSTDEIKEIHFSKSNYQTNKSLFRPVSCFVKASARLSSPSILPTVMISATTEYLVK